MTNSPWHVVVVVRTLLGGNSKDERFGGNMSQRYIWREGERYAESAPNKMAHHSLVGRRVTQNPKMQPMMDDIIDEALFAYHNIASLTDIDSVLHHQTNNRTMTTIGTTSASTTLEDEIIDVIKTMIAKEKKLQLAKKNATTPAPRTTTTTTEEEETPSPRGVADASLFMQEDRKANIEEKVHFFLREVMNMTISITEHSRRFTILPEDVSLALEYFQKYGLLDENLGVDEAEDAADEEEDDEDDKDWDSEIEDVEDEENEEEFEDQEEFDEDEDDDEEEDEHVEEATGSTSLPLSVGRFSAEEFKEFLLRPVMIAFRSDVPMKNAAVEVFRDSLFLFLINWFS